MGMRTRKMYLKYKKYRDSGELELCPLCHKAPIIKAYKYWKIVDNLFPWDKIAQLHHMLVPKRHVTYGKLTAKEKAEFDKIKLNHVEKNYEFMMEAMTKIKTIPAHFHIHLIITKI